MSAVSAVVSAAEEQVRDEDRLSELKTLLEARDSAVIAQRDAKMALDVIGITADADGQQRGLLTRVTNLEDGFKRVANGQRWIVVMAVMVSAWIGLQFYDRFVGDGRDQEMRVERMR